MMIETAANPPIPSAMFFAAMDTVTEGVVIIDTDSRIIYVNDAYTKILRVKKEQVQCKRMAEIEPDALILHTLKDYQPRLHQCVEIKSRGKKVTVNITPVFQENKFIGAVSVFKDITDISLARQELITTRNLSQSIFKSAAGENSKLPAAYSYIIGQDPQFIRCLKMAEIVAPTDAPVLIEGESGAGKEVFVNAVRVCSGGRKQPFISMNCSAIPDTLIESELFGYTSGSFTGAIKGGKAGKFELANGGTIFLDEIGEMPLFMQSKLLRVLQSGEIQKIGSDKIQKVDVRVIAATNRNLQKMVEAGTFREDLYFRLNTFKIVIPPLRKRGNDILLLANFFLKKFADKYHKKLSLSSDTCQVLRSGSWFGNVRQLESCIEYAVIVCTETEIQPRHLPEELHRIDTVSGAATSEKKRSPVRLQGQLKDEIRDVEKEKILQALQQTKGNKTKAMALLGISRRTFYKKIKMYGISQ